MKTRRSKEPQFSTRHTLHITCYCPTDLMQDGADYDPDDKAVEWLLEHNIPCAVYGEYLMAGLHCLKCRFSTVDVD